METSEPTETLEGFAINFVRRRTSWWARYFFFWIWLVRKQQVIAVIEIFTQRKTNRPVSERFVDAVHNGEWEPYREWLPALYREIRPLLVEEP